MEPRAADNVLPVLQVRGCPAVQLERREIPVPTHRELVFTANGFVAPPAQESGAGPDSPPAYTVRVMLVRSRNGDACIVHDNFHGLLLVVVSASASRRPR